MTNFFKVFILINGLIAATFGIFIQMCHLLVESAFSPWLAIPGAMAICGFVYLKTLRVITRRFG